MCGPSTLVPRVFEQMGCRVTYNVEEAIRDADIINLLRIQHERQRKTMFPSLGEYTSLFGLNKRAPGQNQTRRAHHAPRADQPRRGN